MERELPTKQTPELQFVAVQKAVMRGAEHIATAKSITMATRIARALNCYKPGKRGY